MRGLRRARVGLPRALGVAASAALHAGVAAAMLAGVSGHAHRPIAVLVIPPGAAPPPSPALISPGHGPGIPAPWVHARPPPAGRERPDTAVSLAAAPAVAVASPLPDALLAPVPGEAAVPAPPSRGCSAAGAGDDLALPRLFFPALAPAPAGAEAPQEAWRTEVIRQVQARMDARDYPPDARRRRWTGLVRVAFTIGRDGAVRDLRLIASSGHVPLDRCALEAVLEAAPFPPPPGGGEVEVPVSFTLAG
jgi:periplasmic protein TonB